MVTTSKKTVPQDTRCVDLQELEEEYEKDLLTEARGCTTPEEEDSSQEAVPEGKRTKTKKIPFLRKHIPEVKLDFSVLEEAADVKFNEQQQQRILDLINTYHRDSTTWAKGAAPGEAKKCMEDTAKAANKLSALLSCEPPEKHAIVDHYWTFKDLSPLQFQIYLAQIEVSAKDAADDISTGPGNPGNPHIYTLVRRLHYIWTQAGGALTGSNWNGDVGLAEGPFLFFLQLLLERAGEHHSLSALHSVIRSALKT